MTDALLGENHRKEALSLAYLAAVAAKAGYATVKPNWDLDSVDLMIKAAGSMFPQLDVQAKATSAPNWQGNHLRFQLKRKNYDDLRAHRQNPLILVVLELPKDESQWLDCTIDALVMRRSAWWLSLKGYPEIEAASKVVALPEAQRLDPPCLVALMQKVREGVL